MKSVLQFHADPMELVSFGCEIANEYGLCLTALWSKRAMILVRGEDLLTRGIGEFGLPTHLVFSASAPKKGRDLTVIEFIRANPEALSISVGALKPEGLGESSIGFISDTDSLTTVWRQIIGRLRRRCCVGAEVVSLVNGTRTAVKSYRYTSGALSLFEKGVRMLGLGGNVFYVFDAAKA